MDFRRLFDITKRVGDEIFQCKCNFFTNATRMNNFVLMSPQRIEKIIETGSKIHLPFDGKFKTKFLIYYYGYRAQSQIIGSSCALRYIWNRPKCLISNIAKSYSHIISPSVALKVHLRHDYHNSVRDAKCQINWTTDKWEISIKTGWLLTLQPQSLNNSWHISGLAKLEQLLLYSR